MSIAPTLLSVEDLSKSYGGVHAVRGVSFALKAGEILALIGPNGAGQEYVLRHAQRSNGSRLRPD